ncbi:hypothetical protein [Wenyingzhuangia sp. 2_MG-2023]|uniref:hypothetical protein n=1 Tax=Wenyingzhuangia sp. 2_MG-2023 TaxID=3062639 RepID=UPI0026E31F78|nr:hypothetical protein [Wenyingzhuangia sp. 2_MG-2023]MDO6738923.1 hypothetical protein [Wenyingzhuangia sp. 2_MG-2023]
MQHTLTLHQQRKRLNQIFDAIINNSDLSEKEFDKAMQEWIGANQKLEVKEELYLLNIHSRFQTPAFSATMS